MNYLSWENFFEKYLVESTVKTPFQYKKDRINKVYLLDHNAKTIMKEIIDK